MTPPLIELKDLAVAPSPGSAPVIRDLNLSIDPGEVVAILGPNGVGKTTLIRTLAGVLQPQSGQVTLLDRPVRDWRPRERAAQMGVVFQNEVPQFDFTVRDIALHGRFHTSGALGKESKNDREAARDALERMGLCHLADRATPRLSGGEWRRTLLARALAQGAPVLLLDEPSAGLDIGWSHRALRELCQSRDHRGAVIMALHDPNLAATFCSRILLLGPSTLLADGAVEETFRPETLYRAYGTRPAIGVNPYTGKPHIFPHPFNGKETLS